MGLVKSKFQKRKKKLINDCDTLNQSIFFLKAMEKKVGKSINNMNLILDKIKKQYIENKNQIECAICMENKVEYVTVPCGHLYCSKCIDLVNNCFFCRNQITQIQKIYFL